MTGQTTPYLPEVSYDMRDEPPTPIIAHRTRQPASVAASVDSKYWPGGMDAYKTEDKTWFRRPDVVIVNDPSQPPVQSNIKKVVEMKFPPDEFSKTQEAAYMDIAGDESKYAGITPDDCGCGDADEQSQRSSAKQTQTDLESILGGGSNARSAACFRRSYHRRSLHLRFPGKLMPMTRTNDRVATTRIEPARFRSARSSRSTSARS
ncbi:VRR-NUC domain-containing protein [Burkholderia gladioli]|uniref:VRR-NUC domain-containing protein n=1 Tax=Burkholderia gladioli TaxID=28095 RepID=UPI001E3B7B11|nr:VRR-NUC domain-containing protein [Burkholderia gladioli]